MPAKMAKKQDKKHHRVISGRKLDLLIILSGIVLGAATQFLFAHVWQIGNMFLGMFINLVTHNPNAKIWHDLGSYLQVSWEGIVIELIAIVAVILFMLFYFRRSDEGMLIHVIAKLDKIEGELKKKI